MKSSLTDKIHSFNSSTSDGQKGTQWWLLILTITMLFSGCKKNWLDVKPDKSLVVPTSVANFQSMMDHDYLMNNSRPALGEIGSDIYYLHYDTWASISSSYQRGAHIWADDLYGELTNSQDWDKNYEKIYYSNLVLEGLQDIKPSQYEQLAFDNVKGTALFFRAMAFHDLAQVFCKAYDPSTAATDPGIPLKLNANLKEKPTRAPVEQVYQQIISDLEEAADLLPATQDYFTRPTNTAAVALLSRVYLSMEDYPNALKFANLALDKNSALMDYNTAPSGTASNFKEYNEEIIYHGKIAYYFVIDTRSTSRASIDTSFYNSYQIDDLRKQRYFKKLANGIIQFVGDYAGDAYPSGSGYFGGIATDELYLTKAECLVRTGKITEGIDVLNQLLETRWKTGKYQPYNTTNVDLALTFVLEERKKSLVFRGLRWTDLRRLNKDPRFAVVLERNFDNGDSYILQPNSPKYVWPLPPDEVALGGLQQNPR